MTEEVIPLRFDIQEVGKHVKSSKKRFTWELALKGRSHIVVLDFSFISGKVKVTVDRKILFQSQLPSNTSFQYPFTLDGNALNVIQQGDNFELRVNNKVFSHLYNQMRTNTQFKKYQDQVKDIKVDTSKFQGGNKKITLNIGGMGGGMKKKNKGQNYQQHNWNAFSSDSMSFPSYFEGQSSYTTAETYKEQKPKKMQNLLEDNNQSVNTSKTESILNFESQVSKNQVPVEKSNQNLMQFNTMQRMFATMNLGTGNNVQKPSVVIDNNQVDFFNDSGSNQSNIPTPPSQLKEIFKGVSEYNTMQNLFATNQLSNNQMGQNFNTKQSANLNMNTNVNANDFNTMQQLFATNNVSSNLNTNTVNKSVQQKPVATNDFNTMQMLFSTNANNGNPGVNLNMNTTFNTNNQNNNVNTNDFNTMQQLFSTTNPSMTGTFNMVSNQTNSNVQTANFATNSQKDNSSQFNTMQNLFATNSQTSPNSTNLNLGMNINQANLNSNDFNTMQNLFATNSSQIKPNLNIEANMNKNKVNETEFNTMQNLFATNSQANQLNKNNFSTNSNNPKISEAEFNTMQNLFATNSQNTQFNKATSNTTVNNNKNNQSDFNTMQNLFATNNLFSVNMTASNNSSKIQIKSQEQKINNQPLSPNTMYMNTYSGISPQNGGQGQLNMFATGVLPGSGSMKKNKQHSALDMFQIGNNKPASSSGDLL